MVSSLIDYNAALYNRITIKTDSYDRILTVKLHVNHRFYRHILIRSDLTESRIPTQPYTGAKSFDRMLIITDALRSPT